MPPSLLSGPNPCARGAPPGQPELAACGRSRCTTLDSECFVGDEMCFDSTFRRCSDISQYLCKIERVMRQIAARADAQNCMTETLPSTKNQLVAIRDASSLTLNDLLLVNAQAGIPIITRDLIHGRMFRDCPWHLNHLAQLLGDKSLAPRRRCVLSPDWANLEDCPATSIRSFILSIDEERLRGDKAECQPRRATAGYLFDWNLPESAPELCEERRIPTYFASDWLQELRACRG